MDDVVASDARRVWRAVETFHGMIYFASEGPEEYTAIGLEEGRMGYFASRSAAMGPVPAEVVIATFFNFEPSLVRAAIPRAWDLAAPEKVLEARLRVADRSLRRMLGDERVAAPDVAEAAELARTAAEGCFPQGRPLYAAHASLDWPAEPHLALWHAQSLLREFRGDGHVAALVANGIGPLAALVMHGGTGQVPADTLRTTRAWPKDVWDAEVARLRDMGWLDGDGMLAGEGARLRQAVEDSTDVAALAPYQRLGAAGCARLREIGKDLSRALVAAGAFTLTAR